MLSNLLLAISLMAAFSFAWAKDTFVVLSYHDVKDTVVKDSASGQTAVSTANLIAQFDWLKQQGWQVIGLQDVVDARAGKKHLPEKSVLLTFDDGYASFYSKVFPLLKKYRYPALIALVGSWMEAGGTQPSQDAPPRDALLSWDQVKELSRSGLVEVASHSYDLHHGIIGNPQGNSEPAGVTRLYDPATGRYENDAAYAKRIREEMRRSVDSIFKHVGVKPRVLVWPYGETNQALIDAAREAGMTITMGLRDGFNTLADLSNIRRLLLAQEPEIEDFANLMASLRIGDRPLHVAHVDLDYIYDPKPEQTERNLGLLIDRIRGMGVNTVYLQAFTDPDGDGNAEALYFPNRHLPVRADLFNRAAWQLRTRAHVKVYAWMPVLAFRVNAPEQWFVHEWHDGKPRLSSHIYKRLSPFNTEARRVVGEIYEDLAKYCNFSGLLFHDDAILSDYEDVTPPALNVIRKQWGMPVDEKSLRATPGMRMQWAQHKSKALIEWTQFLADKVRNYRPDIKTARNYYTLPLLQPFSEEWYAQSFDTGLAGYDYVALEAMPYMEKAENPEAWLEEVVKKVAAHPDGLKKTVFELQTVDWNKGQKIPMETILKQIGMVQKHGGIHIGYYPENPIENYPQQADMEKAFELPWFP